MSFLAKIFGLDKQAKTSACTFAGQHISKGEEQSAHAKAIEWRQKGEKCCDSQDYDGAVSAYTEAITLNPKYWEALFERGKAYYLKHDVAKALSDLESAISINPKHIGSRLVRGLVYVGEKQYGRVITSFTQLLSIDPKNATAYAERGFAYRQTRQWDKAIQDFNTVLSLDETNAMVYYERGLAHAGTGQCEKAIKDFDKAIMLNLNNSEVYLMRGLIYLGLDKPENALTNLKTASDMGNKEATDELKRLRDTERASGQLRYHKEASDALKPPVHTQIASEQARYHVIDFMRANEISISPQLQQRQGYPFTMDCAKRFFDNFLSCSFEFPERAKSIIIYDGKENLPRHSYAHGFLFSQGLDEIGTMATLPRPVGSIEFEYGGNVTTPVLRVRKG